jgi:hypothetical protein
MGEEVDGDQPRICLGRSPLEPGQVGYEVVVGLIGDHYRLTHRAELYELAEDLVEIASVSQWRGEDNLGELRKDARRRATAIKDAATRLQMALDDLNEQAIEFANLTHWSPHLLEEVFSLERIGPTGVSIFNMPEELSYLERVSRRRSYWSHVRRKFDPIAALPIKGPNPGRTPNLPLQHAVRACRAFWEGVESKEWQSFKLKEKAVRDGNCIADLKNDCEQFVANMMAACGVQFDLQRLHSAWMAAAAKKQDIIVPRAT